MPVNDHGGGWGRKKEHGNKNRIGYIINFIINFLL